MSQVRLSNDAPESDEFGIGDLPEARLLIAVIDRALRDLTDEKTHIRREAKVWLSIDDDCRPFSFGWCCVLAELNMTYVRSLIPLFLAGDPYGFKRRVGRRPDGTYGKPAS